jgi:hypothetical protein
MRARMPGGQAAISAIDARVQQGTRRFPMSTADVDRQRAAEELMHVKRVVETTLEGWDLLSWNELLSDGVCLSLRLGTLDVGRLGELQAASGDIKVFGKTDAKEVLQSIYGTLRKGLSITTEVVSGYDAIVFGNLALTRDDGEIESLPMGVFMAFDSRGRIREMTIAAVDLQAPTDALRDLARAGLAKAA